MDKKLENRIVRLEKLLANCKSVKNESRTDDLAEKIATHLENAMDEMKNFSTLEKELGYPDETIASTQREIDTIYRIYKLYL